MSFFDQNDVRVNDTGQSNIPGSRQVEVGLSAVTSLEVAEQIWLYLKSHKGIRISDCLYNKKLQTLATYIWVHTPLSCDAVSMIQGLLGPQAERALSA